MLNNNTDVNGNKDVINALEQFLQIAKDQALGYIAIVGAKQSGHYVGSYTGTVELEKMGLEGLKDIENKIKAGLLNRTVPEPDPRLDASYVCYNVTQAPLSFDFTTWIVDKEIKRIRANAPAPLKVGFWLGRDGKSGMDGAANRQQMLDHVCRPALKLLGAVEDPIATKGPFEEFFSYKYITEASRNGEVIPQFKTDKQLNIEPGYVTITLREVDYWPHRNSNLKDWLRFADYILAKGERVIFVRDTKVADAEWPYSYPTCPEASKDLETRLALYQKAKCNCFVANGPGNLCFFSNSPFLFFMPMDDQGAYNAGTSQYWRDCAGIEPGEQFPWFNEQQKIVWKPDFYTNIVVAWEETFGSLAPIKEQE